MKSNPSNTNSVAKNSSSKRHITGKKGSGNMDMPPATQKTRSKTTHGHGKANEGTNVSYEEERD